MLYVYRSGARLGQKVTFGWSVVYRLPFGKWHLIGRSLDV